MEDEQDERYKTHISIPTPDPNFFNVVDGKRVYQDGRTEDDKETSL